MRTKRVTSTLIVALSALALGACGGDGGSSAGGGHRAADDRRDGALKFAQCMRDNGVDMPDPKTDENGMVVIEGGGPGENAKNGPNTKKADEACRKYLQDALPQKLSEEQKKEFKDKALAHAKCMREQGIDFPDPRTGEGGDVSIEIGEGAIDPESPKFEAAEKQCGNPIAGSEEAKP